MKHQMVMIAILALGGCASTGAVHEVGDNRYEVNTRATWEFGGRAGAKDMALTEATSKCASMKKRLRVLDESGSYGHYQGGVSSLTFACE